MFRAKCARCIVSALVGLAVSATATLAADSDGDGLPDTLERMLATEFRPVLIFDEEEPKCTDPPHETATLVQVYPLLLNCGGQRNYGALATYVVLYQEDCGDTVFGTDVFGHPHAGDSEAIRLFLRATDWDMALANPESPEYWDFTGALMRRHDEKHWNWEPREHFDLVGEGAADEVSQWPNVYYASGEPLNPPSASRTHPLVFVSEKKHAMYYSKAHCEDYNTKGPVESEDCDEGVRMRVFPINVGDRRQQAFDRLYDTPYTMLGALFGDDEYAFRLTAPNGSAESFCGGARVAHECAGSIGSKWWPPRYHGGGKREADDAQDQMNRICDGLRR